jgi:multiple sugar transport system substrate-binding protein
MTPPVTVVGTRRPARAGRYARRRLVASALPLAPLLAACTASGTGGATGGPPPTNTGGCKSEVEFVSPFGAGSANGDGLVKLAEDYATANQGCKATMLFVGANNNEILEKLVAAVVAGTPPAVALVPAQQTPLWIGKGVIQPLTKPAQRDKVSKEQFFEGYWPQMEIQGQLWRLPLQIDVNFPLFWNKAMLRAGGFAVDKPPATIDELDRLAIALTRSPGEPGGQLGIVPWRQYEATNSLQTWAYAFGGAFHDASATRITANNPKVVQALEWMVGWAKRLGGYEPIQQQMAADPKGHVGLLASGKLAFSGLTSDGWPTAQQVNPQVELGGGPWPGSGAVKPGEATWLSGRGIGIVQGAKDADAAWSFVRWVAATNDGTEAGVRRVNFVPGLKSSPGLKLLEQSPQMAPYVPALRAAKHTPPGAVLPIDTWGNGRGQILTDVLQQKRSPRDALDEITRAAQVDLDAELARGKK